MAICEQCSSSHPGTYGSGRFCQAACARKWVSVNSATKRAATLRANHPEWGVKKEVKRPWTEEQKENLRLKRLGLMPLTPDTAPCPVCGVVFSTLRHKRRRMTCSKECGLKLKRGGRHRKVGHDVDFDAWYSGNFNIPLKLLTKWFRPLFIQKRGGKCEECGWAKANPDGTIYLHIDHVDGDRKNNTVENLKVLCPNCHTLTPTYAWRNHKRS